MAFTLIHFVVLLGNVFPCVLLQRLRQKESGRAQECDYHASHVSHAIMQTIRNQIHCAVHCIECLVIVFVGVMRITSSKW